MKIIVADDEYFARKSVVKMLEEILPEAQICFEAETGQEIIDYMEKNTVDVVFTDIRMPDKDGLEVAEYVQKTSEDTSVVIISGYADFTYASAAIRFGVKEYLTKPVQREKLKETLERLQKRRNVRERIVEERVESRLEREGIRYMNPEDVFSEKKVAEILIERILESGIDRDASWKMTVIGSSERLKSWSRERLEEQRQYFCQHLERMKVWEYYFYPKEEFLLITAGEAVREEGCVSASVRKMAEALMRDRGIRFTAGISQTHQKLNPETLFEAYQECISAAERHFLVPEQQVFVWRQENCDPQEKIVRQLIDYIEENYRYDITLTELANEKFFMNASYLSRVFKAGTGMTFSRYLIRCRMQKAARLLMRPELRIGDVARYVGYNDTSYFIQTFKKYYDTTPEQFRAGKCEKQKKTDGTDTEKHE